MPNSKLKHYLVEMVYVDFHLGLLVPAARELTEIFINGVLLKNDRSRIVTFLGSPTRL